LNDIPSFTLLSGGNAQLNTDTHTNNKEKVETKNGKKVFM
jgi:hypothetical protein